MTWHVQPWNQSGATTCDHELHLRPSGPEGNTWDGMRQAPLTATAVLETHVLQFQLFHSNQSFFLFSILLSGQKNNNFQMEL